MNKDNDPIKLKENIKLLEININELHQSNLKKDQI